MKSNAMTKVAVIIPSYNHGAFLKERLDSLARQTFTYWEAIIIDDTSTDDSVSILREFLQSHPEVKVKHFIVNPTNSGSGYKSWQKGITLATAPYIWIAETDDYCAPDFLEEVMRVYEKNSELALVFTASNYVDNQGGFLYDTGNRMAALEVPDNSFSIFESTVLTDALPLHPYITNGSAVVFRNPKQEIPSAIFSYRQLSDLFLWTYLVQGEKFAFVNKKLNSFRRHETSTTVLNNANNRVTVYNEFVAYLNYFKCPARTVENLVKDYVFNFIMTKNNTKGIFYQEPLKKIKRLSKFRLQWLYLKALLTFVVLKLKKRLNA